MRYPLTVEEYLQRDGSVCPYCGSCDIEGGDPDYAGPIITYVATCNDCRLRWEVVYKMVSYEEVPI